MDLATGYDVAMNDTEKRSKVKMIGWVALAVAVMMLVFAISLIDDWSRDWTTNHAKLDRESPDQKLRPMSIAGNPAEVGELIENWATDAPRWNVVSVVAGSNFSRLHLTHTTPLCRFVDDVRVELTEDGSRTSVHATSSSRIGKGDLGQNPRNLRELTDALEATGRATKL